MRHYVFIFFHCLLCYLLRAHFSILLFARAYIIVLLLLLSDVGRKLSINGYYFIFLAYTNVYSVLSSHSGWLLLKWSAIGIGFNGAETNCRIAHILGILLMISY